MRKLYFLTIICLLFAGILSGQTEKTIKLIPSWTKGDTKRFEITNSTNVVSNGIVQIKSLTTKTVALQVINVRSNTTDIEWKYENITFTDTISNKNPFSLLMNELNKGMTVKYSINGKGAIKSVTNYDEIYAKIKLKVDSALQVLSKNEKIDSSKMELIKFQYSMMFSSTEQIDKIALSDIFRFHQLYGYTFKTHQLTSIEDKIFAPKMSGPSDRSEIKLDSIDTIKQLYYLKGESRSPFLEKYMTKVTKNRSIKLLYIFKYPENWLVEHNYILTTGVGESPVKFDSNFRIRMIK